MNKKFERIKLIFGSFKKDLLSSIENNNYINRIKNNFKFPKNSSNKYDEVRYKPIPRWTKSLQWAIVGFISFGFLYSIIARIDEVVIAQGDLESQGAERPIKAPVPGIVSSILVKEGELVKKNQIVLEFDTEINNKRLNSLSDQLEFEKLNLSEEVKLYKSRRNMLNASINAAKEVLEIDNLIIKKMENILDEGAVSEFEFLQKNKISLR